MENVMALNLNVALKVNLKFSPDSKVKEQCY